MTAEDLWAAYGALLLRHAKVLLDDPRAAVRSGPEDLVQDMMAKLLKSDALATLGELNDEARRAYLLTALRHAATDQFRRDFETEKRSLDREKPEDEFRGNGDESFAGLGGVLAANHTSPSSAADRNDKNARLAEAIAGLPERQRQIILLDQQGLAMADIASVMGLTTIAASSLYYRTLKAIKAKLRVDTGGP